MNIEAITAGLRAATEAADLFARAIEAANNGDEIAARNYLAAARGRYDESRAAWDAAKPSP